MRVKFSSSITFGNVERCEVTHTSYLNIIWRVCEMCAFDSARRNETRAIAALLRGISDTAGIQIREWWFGLLLGTRRLQFAQYCQSASRRRKICLKEAPTSRNRPKRSLWTERAESYKEICPPVLFHLRKAYRTRFDTRNLDGCQCRTANH